MDDIREVSVKDLIKTILLKWRWMIGGMLLCAVLLNGFYYLKTKKAAESTPASSQLSSKDSVEAKLTALKANLSEREVTEVMAAVKSYQNFYENYLQAIEYSENSIRMKLDASCVPTVRIDYYIDTHYEVVYPQIEKSDPVEDIIVAYSAGLVNESVFEAVCAEVEKKIESKYIRELFSVGQEGKATLSITALGEDREFCDAFTKVVTEKIEELTPGIQATYGDFDIELSGVEYYERAHNSLLAEQQTRSTGINNLRTYLGNADSMLSEKQKEYFSALLDETEKEIAETENEQEVLALETTASEIKTINIKYLLVGGILGILIVCMYGFFEYLFCPDIHTAQDIENNYPILVWGTLNKKKGKKRLFAGIDRWIETVFDGVPKDEAEKFDFICTNICVEIQKSGMNKIFITSTCEDDWVEEIKTMLKARLSEKIEGIEVGKSIITDADAYQKFAFSDGVVLVEKTYRSRFRDIDRVAELCKNNSVKIIGGIVASDVR